MTEVAVSLAILLALNGRADENVLQVFEFILELSILKHDIFKVSFTEVLCETYLVILLAKSLHLVSIFLHNVVGTRHSHHLTGLALKALSHIQMLLASVDHILLLLLHLSGTTLRWLAVAGSITAN